MKHAMKTGAYETLWKLGLMKLYKNWGLWNTLWKLGLMKHAMKTGAYETRYENWSL
jgi:hypothetical protein